MTYLQVGDQDLEGGDSGIETLRRGRAGGSKSNLLIGVGQQSSAVNLNRLAPDSDLKRLIEEVGPLLLHQLRSCLITRLNETLIFTQVC